ncbi:MAG TPA: DinB family protein [Pyrinomonadaceae bacterium]
MRLIKKAFPVVEGLTPELGRSLAAMEEVRAQLHEAVHEMSVEDLACEAVAGAHSIGVLVLHIGESEWFWLNCVIKGHKLTDEDRQQPFWDVLKDPKALAAKNYSADFCLETIDGIRQEMHGFLASLTDADLENVYSYTRGSTTMEASLRWILHHLIDHEAQHKGQILMLKRLLSGKTEDFI